MEYQTSYYVLRTRIDEWQIGDIHELNNILRALHLRFNKSTTQIGAAFFDAEGALLSQRMLLLSPELPSFSKAVLYAYLTTSPEHDEALMRALPQRCIEEAQAAAHILGLQNEEIESWAGYISNGREWFTHLESRRWSKMEDNKGYKREQRKVDEWNSCASTVCEAQDYVYDEEDKEAKVGQSSRFKMVRGEGMSKGKANGGRKKGKVKAMLKSFNAKMPWCLLQTMLQCRDFDNRPYSRTEVYTCRNSPVDSRGRVWTGHPTY